MENQKTGRLIASARREKQLTQQGLAERLGVTAQAVSKWEKGRSFPDPSLVEPLGQALGLSLAELFAGERQAAGEMQARESGRRPVSRGRWLLRGKMCLIFLAGTLLLALAATVFGDRMAVNGNLVLNGYSALYYPASIGFPIWLAWWGCGRRQRLEPYPPSDEGFWRTWFHRELPCIALLLPALYLLSDAAASFEPIFALMHPDLQGAFQNFQDIPALRRLTALFLERLFWPSIQGLYAACYVLYSLRRCRFRCKAV